MKLEAVGGRKTIGARQERKRVPDQKGAEL